jgi:hypothetical protein
MFGEPVSFGSDDMKDEELDLLVTQALERVPEVRIADDFAARVAARLPERRPAALPRLAGLRTTRFGVWALRGGLLVLLVAMLVVAPRTVGHGAFWMVVQLMLCVEFIGFAVWMEMRVSRRSE